MSHPRYQPPVTPPQWQQGSTPRDYRPPQVPPPRYEQPAPAPQYQPPPGPPQRRRRPGRRLAVPAIAGLVVLAVAGGAYALVQHRDATAAPLTCAQQYASWKTGSAYGDGKQLATDANAVSTAGKNDDITAVDSSLKTLGAEAATLEAYPMPACADPKGYWAQSLADMKAAGDNAGSASGLSGVILAEAPLKKVTPLEAKLSAELAKTAGVKDS